MPPVASSAPAAEPPPPPVVVHRFGTILAPWFPADSSPIRCGCIDNRVFVDVKEVLQILTTTQEALKELFVNWFSGPTFEQTRKRFGVDRSHWKRVRWGTEGDKRVTASLFLMLPALRSMEGDPSTRLANEIESRIGLGLELAVQTGLAATGTGATVAPVTPVAPVVPPAASGADLAEIKQTLAALTEKMDRFETHVLSPTATTIDATDGRKRTRTDAGDENERCTRAKYEAEMALANYERDHPDQAYTTKFRVLREQIVLASREGDSHLHESLRAKLSELVRRI